MSPEFRNQIVGLIRFSFVTTGDFYPGFDTVADMKAFLFDEARLERRFRLFEGICLPVLKAQTDPDFTCIFLVAQDFPKRWRKRLDRLLDGLAFVRIVEKPPMPHYQGIREAFAEVPNAGFTHRTTFRLDDDDAVNLNFIATLRALAAKVHVIPDRDEPIGISFNRGLYLTYSKTGTSYQRAVERTPLSIGTALLAPVSFAATSMPITTAPWGRSTTPGWISRISSICAACIVTTSRTRISPAAWSRSGGTGRRCCCSRSSVSILTGSRR